MANFFFNEMSFNENIKSADDLHVNIEELVRFHSMIKNAQHTVYLHREALYGSSILGVNFYSAIEKKCTPDTKRKIRSLIDRSSPALPEDGVLDVNIRIFLNGQDICCTALGECAARIHIKEGKNACYSIENSNFTEKTITVSIVEKEPIDVSVPNIHTITHLQKHLSEEFPAFERWENVIIKANIFLQHIKFEDYVLKKLQTFPFARNVANDVYTRLEELNELSKAPQADFHELYQKYCTGEKAHFSGSSDDEKRDFEEELSFMVDGKKTLCPFHGKVKNQQFRIHIAGLAQSQIKARVVYIGPKLTKR